jgi:hypothetical protein
MQNQKPIHNDIAVFQDQERKRFGFLGFDLTEFRSTGKKQHLSRQSYKAWETSKEKRKLNKTIYILFNF